MTETKSEGISPLELDWVNYLNIVLMGISAVVAVFVPLELFLFSYAVLGPLHYLTEISWLHDRRYFAAGKFEWRLLLLPVIPGTVGLIYKSEVAADLYLVTMLVAFTLSAGMVFGSSGKTRIFVLCGIAVALVSIAIGAGWGVLFTILLPTLVHVYAFTGLFILLGALKSKSFSAFLSLGVYLLCPFVLLYVSSTPHTYIPAHDSVASMRYFTGVRDVFLQGFGFRVDREGILAFMRLMAFAYTYHYLNWFSKTRIINWHQISRRRLGGIVVLYLCALAIYLYDFNVGLIALFALSLGHVLLELPLNFRSIATIWGEVKLLVVPR